MDIDVFDIVRDTGGSVCDALDSSTYFFRCRYVISRIAEKN